MRRRNKATTKRAAHRALVIFGVLGVCLVLLAGGLAFAGYQFSERYEGRILPGATIAGAEVGGMTEEEAIETVSEKLEPQLNREIELVWGKKTWTVTPEELGAQGNAPALVREAFERSDDASFTDKLRMRVLSDDLGYEREVAFTYPDEGAQGFVQGIAKSINKEPRDASLDYSSGWVEIVKERTGRKVKVRKTYKALMTALKNGSNRVELAVDEMSPEKTRDAFDQVLLVRIGENKLYLYQNGKITHSWPVATGQPEYPTPTGLFEVTLKRYMPTWVNPSPDGWGADMPASISPGPGNPLGLRAINWDAPAIRFHGTSATYSLGYNASHGCVRMSNADVIELYDMIDEGVPIVSTQVSPFKPMYRSSPDPTPVSPDGPSDEGSTGSDGGKKKSGDGD